MHRLLVPEELMSDAAIALPDDAARHLKVVRPRAGEEIELFDGRGRTRRCTWDGRRLVAGGPATAFPAPRTELVLFACITKGSRWDWTIEKAVELGTTRIVPVISDRCIVRLPPAERAAKADRWEVLAAVDFADSLELVKSCGHVFAGALCKPPPPPIWNAVTAVAGRAVPSLGIFVGPEGDFTPDELRALLEFAAPVSFGPTILRAETAAIFGLSVLAAARAASA